MCGFLISEDKHPTEVEDLPSKKKKKRKCIFVQCQIHPLKRGLGSGSKICVQVSYASEWFHRCSLTVSLDLLQIASLECLVIVACWAHMIFKCKGVSCSHMSCTNMSRVCFTSGVVYRKGTSIRQVPELGISKHYGKAHGSSSSG